MSAIALSCTPTFDCVQDYLTGKLSSVVNCAAAPQQSPRARRGGEPAQRVERDVPAGVVTGWKARERRTAEGPLIPRAPLKR
jgi:hypothetical protein